MDRYEKYKDSGVHWLGDIPAHWKIQRLKRCCELIRMKMTNHQSEKISLENIEGWTGKYISTESNYECSGVSYQKDDVLFGKLRPYLAKVYLTEREGEALGDFWVLRCFSIYLPKYLRYLLISKPIIDLIDSTTYGAKMPRADWSENSKMFVPIPTIIEQTTIVSHLDSITARIDEAIVRLQRMIDLLNERKQIIIHNAVTKGLNSDVKMKDSGVKWIGMIPEHWNVFKIKTLIESSKDGIKIGPFGSSLTGKVESDLPYKIYGQWNVSSRDFSVGNNFVSSDTFQNLKSYNVQSGDILVSMMGTIGRCAIVPDDIIPGIMDSHVIKLRLNQKIVNKQFFVYSYDKEYNKNSLDAIQILKKGSIMDALNSSIVKQIIIAVPSSLLEQEEIVRYIDSMIRPIEQAIESSNRQIFLLRERKQIIINDVVTGKVKVS